MLNEILFNIIFYGFLVGIFVFSVSCFDDCHIIKFGCCCGCQLWKTIKQTIIHSNKYPYPQQQNHNNTRGRGIQGGGISFFISYISLAIYTRVQLKTFHILSINNANKCGNCVELCGHTFSYLAPQFTL